MNKDYEIIFANNYTPTRDTKNVSLMSLDSAVTKREIADNLKVYKLSSQSHGNNK